MKKKRSPPRILASRISLNAWRNQMPSVEEARPSRCPCCGVPSRPLGKPLNLHGHGQRERQVRGPLEPAGPPVLVTLMLRRYRCQRCGATMTVGPKGLLAGLLFSAAAVALALCLWALDQLPQARVHAQVNPWQRAAEQACGSWRQLVRWAQGIAAGRLWPGLVPGPPPFCRRLVAQRAAAALSARCPPQLGTAPLRQQVFLGAALTS